MRWLDLAWRVPATGVAFLCIFFGGGVLALCLRPILALCPGNRRERTRHAIHRLFRLYLALLRACGLARVQVTGAERLALVEGHVVVANHPSLLDVVILVALIPRAQCIVKHQLWRHRFLGPLMRQAGYISNALDPQDMIAACAASLAAGESLVIFPEGTRTQPGQPLVFQRGFAHMAVDTGAPILPVTITCDPPTLIRGEPWWRVPPRPPLFQVVVGHPVSVAPLTKNLNRGLGARRIVKYFLNYYESKGYHV